VFSNAGNASPVERIVYLPLRKRTEYNKTAIHKMYTVSRKSGLENSAITLSNLNRYANFFEELFSQGAAAMHQGRVKISP